MVTFEIRRHVDAPPEKVFAYASDFPNAAERIRGIQRIEMLTDGPVGVGTRFKETRVMFKREASETMEVTVFEPPHRYALGAQSCGCRYHTELRCEPGAGGGTDLVMIFDAQPITFMGKVLSFVMRPLMKSCLKQVGADLDDVKAAAEGDPGGDAERATRTA